MITRDFALQDTIYRLIQERPDIRKCLEEMVEWENRNPPVGPYAEFSGWEWKEVHTAPFLINLLIARGIVDQRSGSRAHTSYRLHSLVDAIDALTAEADRVGAPVALDELFELVVGHEKIKELIKFAVCADRPVHVLLEGPPGTAKTLMLQDIGRLPGAQFYVGSTTTKSGLVGLLLSEHPRYLIIDELDKMADLDMSPMLNLMETGMVTRLQHGSRERVEMDTRVFAGCNDSRHISAAILSRFAKFEIGPYSDSQFLEVAREVLIKREGQGPEMAALIANEVSRYSTDIRDAVRVARMARGNPKLVLEVVECLWPKGRRVAIPVPVRRRR